MAALHTLTRNALLMGASLSYFLLWFAHTGLVSFVNLVSFMK